MRTSPTRGQSLVEFTLIGSLLIAMLLGMFDFAMAYNSQMILRGAVAEGAYYIAQFPGEESGAESRIRMNLEPLPGYDDPTRTVIVIDPQACMNRRQDTIVTVTYEHEFLFSSVVQVPRVTLTNSMTVPQFGPCQ